MTRRPPPSILALSGAHDQGLGPDELVDSVAAAVGAGLEGLLLRERGWNDGLLLATARRLRQVMGSGWLGLSDAIHLVEACGADGVHLSHQALSAQEARRLLGDKSTIGISDHRTHPRSDCAHADYVFLSPVHAVPHKGQPLGLEGALAWSQEHDLPTWALGGLGPDDLGSLRKGGFAGAAFVRGLLGSPDPAQAFRNLQNAWESSP